MTTENKLNVFIDAGNEPDEQPKTEQLLSEIALVKNMDHVKSVFVFADEQKGNKLKEEALSIADNTLKAAREEYKADAFIGITGQLNDMTNKVVIYNSKNDEFVAKLTTDKNVKNLAENALMICVPSEKAELNVLSLFTHKTPTAFKNIQLVVPKGSKDNNQTTALHTKVMDMVKDAKRLRELKINILTNQAGGAFFGLFGKKKYDEKAAEIAKKLLKDPETFTDGVKAEIKAELEKYYGYDSTKTKNSLAGSALKKWTEAKNNVARALYTVEKLLAEAAEPKKEKTPSYSTIDKMADYTKTGYQGKKNAERAAALGERGIKIEKGESAKLLNMLLITPRDKNVTKGALGVADLIICHKDDKTPYSADVSCIKYDNKSIDTLDLLLTAQFSEPTRLRTLFTKGTGTKKASFRSQVKRGISRMGNIDIKKTRKARESSRERMTSKAKRDVIKKESSTQEAINTKKAELKRAKFYQFTKKKQLQANIAELEKKKAAKAAAATAS